MNKSRKTYILDTNVLVHDPSAIQNFDEHNVVIPIAVLEEMDHLKKGFDEVARNVREASRELDSLSLESKDLVNGCPLSGGGRLYFELNHCDSKVLPVSFSSEAGDNRILAVALNLQKDSPDKQIILVSKDINLRIKGRALGVASEDYRTGSVLSDMSILPNGVVNLVEPHLSKMWASAKEVSGSSAGAKYEVKWPTDKFPNMNEFISMDTGREFKVSKVDIDSGKVTINEVSYFKSKADAVWGVRARNQEQNMALDLLMDANIDIVTMLGLAGSGKTLLALAAGLSQADSGTYDRIIVTRAPIPVGDSIGFLPGDETDKMLPWMGAITDNLALLLGDSPTKVHEIFDQYAIEIAAMSFARGRTFQKTWLIVDEAQNLTPHQAKTLVTRMGEDSKIVLLGNNQQIDTPYLTAKTNGLTYAVSKMLQWAYSGTITLRESERSRLAAYAAENM